jgi:hypothetical protein
VKTWTDVVHTRNNAFILVIAMVTTAKFSQKVASRGSANDRFNSFARQLSNTVTRTPFCVPYHTTIIKMNVGERMI